jgi:hypothetical protein
MSVRSEQPMAKWPYFVADGILISFAGLLVWLAESPLSAGVIVLTVLMLVIGAVVALTPYLIEHYRTAQLAEDPSGEGWLEVPPPAVLEKSLAREGPPSKAAEAPSAPHGEEKVDLQPQQEEVPVRQEAGQRIQELAVPAQAEMQRLFQQEEVKRQVLQAQLDEVVSQVNELRREVVRLQHEIQRDGSIPMGGEVEIQASEVPEESGLSESALEEEVPVQVEEPLPEPEAAPEARSEPRKPVARRSAPRKVQVRQDPDDALFSTSTVVATAFIGAGNKLFLRGEGPGLSWEKGVPMQFLEIGKWSWSLNEANGPVQIQLFLNDEEADKGGVLTLAPGQRLDVRPDFEP